MLRLGLHRRQSRIGLLRGEPGLQRLQLLARVCERGTAWRRHEIWGARAWRAHWQQHALRSNFVRWHRHGSKRPRVKIHETALFADSGIVVRDGCHPPVF